jgi:hypothetical protein
MNRREFIMLLGGGGVAGRAAAGDAGDRVPATIECDP